MQQFNIQILPRIGLAPCFSPKYKIIVKFEGFYFLSVVLVFPIFGSSSLQINKSTEELGKNTKERKFNFLSDILNSWCHEIKVSTQFLFSKYQFMSSKRMKWEIKKWDLHPLFCNFSDGTYLNSSKILTKIPMKFWSEK